MNRTKKITKKFMGKAKKANAKKNTSNKPKYISKAEREHLEALAASDNVAQEPE
ncbi:DUF2986 domain-containing protein [Shewanella sp. KX20019]|uniref:DUF2986 domain-containing protein n=1 Tax=Shewanella sp. KX20019 TaxID=2803864 RepID=UPI001927E3B6|nr:DUF2986 domain-containing protein [Shewanella sp. KX20019]QQX80384.1 DUF2986 domain-containing protein [Shewanella sp. KX20019]